MGPSWQEAVFARVLGKVRFPKNFYYQLLAKLLSTRPKKWGRTIAIYDPELDILAFPDAVMLGSFMSHGYVTDASDWLGKLDHFIPTDGIVFDVGANRGVTAQCFARRAAKVFAFEPVPDNVASLRKVLRARNIDNVQVIEAAVSNRIGQADLHVFKSHDHASLGPAATSKPLGKISVATTTIDSFCEEHGIQKIDFMKMDVEGYEFEALTGAQQMLGRQAIGLLLFEAGSSLLGRLGKSSASTYDLLRDNGYSILDLDEAEVTREHVVSTAYGDFLARSKYFPRAQVTPPLASTTRPT